MAQSIAELEAELGGIEARLWPLYSAQEEANIDAHNASAAQASASGAALTDAVLAVQKYGAEVAKYTKEIAPLKERAETLRRAIEASKHAEWVATFQRHVGAAAAAAPQVTASFGAFRDHLTAFITELNALGSKDVNAEVRALARYFEVELHNAGLPDYRREGVQFHGQGASPMDVAATAMVFADTMR